MKKMSLFFLIGMILALSACSGGGSTTTTIPVFTTTAPATPAPTVATPAPTAVTNTFPVVNTPSIATQRINFFRQLVGIPLVTEDAALNLAAKNHFDYLVVNQAHPLIKGQLIHEEIVGLNGFTGVGPLDRYVQVRGSPFYDAYVAESIASYADQTLAIHQLINSVYHQLPLLHAHVSHIGVASLLSAPYDGTIIDIVQPVAKPAVNVYVYPSDGYSSASIDFYGEIPDPMRASVVAGQVTGSVMSMYAPKHVLKVSGAVFTEVATGTAFTVEIIDSVTDPNQLLSQETVFFIPHQVLKPLTQYRISVQYSLDGGATQSRMWGFTTG